MLVVVLGANGQLGARCCAALVARGHRVRGVVRDRRRAEALASAGIEVAVADVTRPETVPPALQDADALVVTANAAGARRGDVPAEVARGIARAVDDAMRAGLRRLVLVSVPMTAVAGRIPMMRSRRLLEARLEAATDAGGTEGVVLRFPPFMEVWLALVGSSIPLRGEPYATIGRPSPFLQRFRRATGTLVEDRGLMLVSGSPANRNAFIGIADVTRAVVEAVERRDLAQRTFEVGGPEVLTWVDVAQAFSDALHRRVRIVSTPGAVYRTMARALGPVAAMPAQTMGLNWLMAESETPWSPGGGGLVDPSGMVTVREFIEEKLRLPPDLPVVP